MISRLLLGAYSVLIFLIWPLGMHVDTASLFADVTPSFNIEVHENVRYYDGPNAHSKKHLLDVYSPVTDSITPVLFFVHGGAWEDGDKAIHRFIGNNFSARGYTTVVINYRLSPAVRHPAHIRDVARAFSWVYENIEQFRGDRERISLMGHSAGGHLISLLALDESYLAEHNLETNLIKGVIPVSGVYDLTEYPSLFFLDTFDTEPESRSAASPINHVDEDQPPFLILYGEHDYPTLEVQA